MSKDRKEQESKEKKNAPGDEFSGKSKPVSEYQPDDKGSKSTSTQRDTKSDGKRKS